MTSPVRQYDPETPSGGALHALVSERLAPDDARTTANLDRLIAAGLGDLDRSRGLALIPEPTPMPAKKTPHACCGSLSRHRRNCPEHGRKTPKAPEAEAAPITGGFDPRAFTDDQLAVCVEEAKRRIASRDALARALGVER